MLSDETFTVHSRIYTNANKKFTLGGKIMQSKRKRILTMLENGTISMDEALSLLENLSESQEVEKEHAPEVKIDTTKMFEEEKSTGKDQKKSESTEKEDPSTDEFLEDLRKEFTHVGDRFMQFMQTTVQKMKGFDFESPFGQALTFNQTMTKPAGEIDEIIIDIDNGKVAVQCSDEDEVRAEFTVKMHNSESEEEAKEAFNEKMLFVTDANKLRISSAMKMTKVEINLYVPRKNYAKLSARLLNGSFKMNQIEIESVRVKTANGKIDVSDFIFKEAAFETANGAIELHNVEGEKLEAETLNGRVYIDGQLKDVEAQSLSGAVAVTTTDLAAERIDAKTVSGSVELYVPSNISLSGEILSNLGKLNLQLNDVDRTAEQEQFLQRSIRFKKNVENDASPLQISGETKTGSVIVYYNA